MQVAESASNQEFFEQDVESDDKFDDESNNESDNESDNKFNDESNAKYDNESDDESFISFKGSKLKKRGPARVGLIATCSTICAREKLIKI